MPEYTVQTPVNHNGEFFIPAETVTMEESTATSLMAVGALSAKVAVSRPNAKDAIAMAKAAETIETLATLEIGEDRPSVLAAIEARRKELAPEGAE
jgi:hypothetical protein